MLIRNINRLLEISDINIERFLAETSIRRPKKPNENDRRIQNLVQRLETGQPTPITPLDFVKAMAHLQTSKFKYNEDAHSDSDSEEADGDEAELAEQQPGERHTSCLDCWNHF